MTVDPIEGLKLEEAVFYSRWGSRVLFEKTNIVKDWSMVSP